jgi:isopenicillin-N N-acyltransferase-like protein
MKIFVRVVILLVALVLTWGIRMLHIGTFLPPKLPVTVVSTNDEPAGAWVGRDTYGINQLVLRGSPYARGLEAGHLTQNFLYAQEAELTQKLFHFIPRWLFLALEPLGVEYFRGIEDYFEPWMTQEMFGVSKSAPHEFDYLGSGYTRQITYHGIHEIGQMMVDQKGDVMGCTVAAVPTKASWIVGRNFDFEGGRIFDQEKIMKWVFPDDGNAFISVIWAGMVGAVTGVNEKGLYVSINAAGSKDFRRIGTPSTLVLLKILQYANTAEDALAILQKETMFITDIFVLLDSRAGKLYRIEKSPARIAILPLTGPSVVANHLVSDTFANDATNLFRRNELTSEARQIRGELLLKMAFPEGRALSKSAEGKILEILRDKGDIDGKPLGLGNRNAIDSLIAAHSVVFNGDDQTLYVGKGPGVSGGFLGFDLTASFKARTPIRKGGFPADPRVSEETFTTIRTIEERATLASRSFAHRRCAEGAPLLAEAVNLSARLGADSYELATAEGDADACRGDLPSARSHWRHALDLHPAYLSERTRLQKHLQEASLH